MGGSRRDFLKNSGLVIAGSTGFFTANQWLAGADGPMKQQGNPFDFDKRMDDAQKRAAEAAANTADALAGFSLGLVGFSVYLFVLRAFYAHQDTRTPFVVNVLENALNVVLAFALVGRFGVLGLGLAFAIAYLVSAAFSLVVLRNKVRGFTLRPVALSFWKHALAAVLMGEAVWFVTGRLGGDTGMDAIVQLVVGAAGGAIVYVVLLVVLRSPEVDVITKRLTGLG